MQTILNEALKSNVKFMEFMFYIVIILSCCLIFSILLVYLQLQDQKEKRLRLFGTWP